MRQGWNRAILDMGPPWTGAGSKVPRVASLGDLLPLQELDTRAMQLRHRREHLDLRADLADAEKRLAAQQGVVEEIRGRLHAVRRAQKEAEDHASLIEDRAAVVEKSMYDGSVTDPKELGALQTDLAQLRSNQDGFETTALEAMEEADPIEAELELALADSASIEAGIADVGERITVAEAEIDAELDGVATQREQVQAGIDPELVTLYDSFAGLPGGIAVAEMDGRRCGGCHLEIPSAQAEKIRAATDPSGSTCPECGCLLVT